MQGRDSLRLARGPRRYPLLLAAGWLFACGVVDAASGSTLRTELFYLPAILFGAWYYDRWHAVALAWLAATAATLAEFATTPGTELHVLYWNVLALGGLFSLVAWLAAELRAQQHRVAALLTTDLPSGFLNRIELLAKLDEELIRTERFGGDTSLVCIGLNGFPRFLMERGVEQAEALLNEVCAALRVLARKTDVVARLDDDEFAILLRGTGHAAAAVVADKLERAMTEHLLTQGNDLTCSVGYTTAPLGRVLDAQALLAQSVAQMYEHRASGQRPRRADPVKEVLCSEPAPQPPRAIGSRAADGRKLG
jgi:diguanylate cyclase (GGDEF)-like protein